MNKDTVRHLLRALIHYTVVDLTTSFRNVAKGLLADIDSPIGGMSNAHINMFTRSVLD